MDSTCTSAIDRCRQGSIKLSGNGSVKIWGLDSGPWRGILMWQDGQGVESRRIIDLTGNGRSIWRERSTRRVPR